MEAARRLNLSVVIAQVVRVEDFPNAFAMIRGIRADGLLVMTEPLIGGQRAQVIAFAASARLPTSYDNGNIAREGGLVSYGPLYVEHYVMAAGYVDKILKGAKPADLPVEQPDKVRACHQLEYSEGPGTHHSAVATCRADDKIQ